MRLVGARELIVTHNSAESGIGLFIFNNSSNSILIN